MFINKRRLAGAVLLGLCIGNAILNAQPTAAANSDQCDQPRENLKNSVQISAGGPYATKVGVPITLQGTYTVAGQTANMNQLKVIGQALKSYLNDHGSYPPAALLNAKGQRTVSWRVLILPYLGENALYNRFDLAKPWNDEANEHLLREMPAVYRKSGADECTTDTGFAGVQGTNTLFQNASTELNGGHPASGVTANEEIAVGPVGAGVHLPWTAPGDIDANNAIHIGSAAGFSGEGNAFTPLLFLDGTVHLMPDTLKAAAMIPWTHLAAANMMMGCACTPPNSVDAGFRAVWDLNGGKLNAQGFSVPFVAYKSGKYTVTLHMFDNFGNEYNSSAAVEVH